MEIRQTKVYAAWFARLKDERARAKINARIYRLSMGNAGDVRPVGAGISEMCIDCGPGYRIYFIARGKMLVILLCGGDKSGQSKDIDLAKALAANLEDET